MRYAVFTLVLAVARGQFLTSPADPVDPATLDAMFRAACQGKIVKGQCLANPVDGMEGSWNLQAVRFGHFLSPKSEDAIVTTSGFEPLDWFPVGSLLLSKRAGKWVALGIYQVHLDIRKCVKLRLPSGRDSLVCQVTNKGPGSVYLNVVAIEADHDDLNYEEVFVGPTTTQRCEPSEATDRIQKTILNNVSVGDAKVGQHIMIAVLYGEMNYSPALQRACQAAIEKKPGARFRDPPMTPYLLEYVFDGLRFLPTAQSEAQANKFKP